MIPSSTIISAGCESSPKLSHAHYTLVSKNVSHFAPIDRGLGSDALKVQTLSKRLLILDTGRWSQSSHVDDPHSGRGIPALAAISHTLNRQRRFILAHATTPSISAAAVECTDACVCWRSTSNGMAADWIFSALQRWTFRLSSPIC